ncbi:hypothetical protein HNO89_002155 [Sporosarcina luteola]|nr:hypothetical protein [Sporosarcina luteola]
MFVGCDFYLGKVTDKTVKLIYINLKLIDKTMQVIDMM